MIKKRILSLMLVGAMIFTVGCGNSSGSGDSSNGGEPTKKEEKKETKVEKPDNIDTSWYVNDNSVIANGIYTVGKDIAEGAYLFTVSPNETEDDDHYAFITLFESSETYTAYWRTHRFTIGEESDALEANAKMNVYVEPEEPYRISLQNGNIIIVNGDLAYMKPADGDSEIAETVTGKSMTLYRGTYNPGDIPEGQYMLTKADDSVVNVLIFDNETDYNNYTQSGASTVGDEIRARETHGLYEKYLDDCNTYCLSVDSDMVIVIEGEGSEGYLEQVTMGWSVK